MRPVIILGPNVHVYDIQVTLQRVLGQCLGFQFGEKRLGDNAKGNNIGTRTCVTISGLNVGYTGRGLNLQVTLVSGT